MKAKPAGCFNEAPRAGAVVAIDARNTASDNSVVTAV